MPTAGDDPKTSHVGGRNAQLATRGLRPIVIFCAAHMEMDMTGFSLFAASASVLLLLLPARSEEGTAHQMTASDIPTAKASQSISAARSVQRTSPALSSSEATPFNRAGTMWVSTVCPKPG